MISAAEAALLLGMSPRRVQALCQQRRIPGARLLGSRQLGKRTWALPDVPTITPAGKGPRLRHAV